LRHKAYCKYMENMLHSQQSGIASGQGEKVRRHAFFVSVSFSAGIYLSYIFQFSWIDWVITCIFYMVGVLFIPGRKLGMISIILAGLLLGAGLMIQFQNHQNPAVLSADRSMTIKGEVLTVAQNGEKAALTIKTTQGYKMLADIYTKNPDYATSVGKWIQATGKVELPKEAGNPGGFDYRLYLRSVGVQTIMTLKPDDVWLSKEPCNRLSHELACFRETFHRRLAVEIGEEKAGIAFGILLGDRTAMDDATYEEFQRNGTAHILSVSGLHIGFVYGMLIFMIRGKRKPIPNGLIVAMLLLYGFLSGFCPSVNRALLMIGLHVLSKVLCRPYDLLTSAGIAGFLLLLGNPFQLFHIGFQLSFLAVVLMGWLYPMISCFLSQKSAFQFLLPIPLLQLSMAPYTAYCFNYFSLGGFIANVGVVFFSGLMIPIGIAAMLLCMMPGPFFNLSADFLDICLRCTLWFNDVTYAHGKTSFDMTSPSVFVIIIFYGLFFFCFSEFGRILWIRRKKSQWGAIVILIFVAAAGMNTFLEDGFEHADAVFVDVGQGDCLHIRTPAGHNILIDGGGKEKFDVGKRIVKPYLLKNGVKKIDLAIATHLDMDHYRGLQSLAKNGMVKRLGLYGGNRLIVPRIQKETGLAKDQLDFLSEGEKIKVDKWLWLEILYPEEKSNKDYENELVTGDENPRSLVVRAHLGQNEILMTGDIDAKTEEDMMRNNRKQNLSAEILKVAHHGSRFSTSDAFLMAVNPTVAVFQVGKNNYGHPDSGVLEKCRQKGIITYRTDQNGAVGFFGLFENRQPSVKIFKSTTMEHSSNTTIVEKTGD